MIDMDAKQLMMALDFNRKSERSENNQRHEHLKQSSFEALEWFNQLSIQSWFQLRS